MSSQRGDGVDIATFRSAWVRSVNGREGEVPGTSGELSECSRSANDLHLILRLWDAKMLELDLVLRCTGEILIFDQFLVTLSSIWSWNYFRGPVTTVLEFLPSLHIGSNGDPPEDHLRTYLELIQVLYHIKSTLCSYGSRNEGHDR